MTNNQSATVSPFEPLQAGLINEKVFYVVSLWIRILGWIIILGVVCIDMCWQRCFLMSYRNQISLPGMFFRQEKESISAQSLNCDTLFFFYHEYNAMPLYCVSHALLILVLNFCLRPHPAGFYCSKCKKRNFKICYL